MAVPYLAIGNVVLVNGNTNTNYLIENNGNMWYPAVAARRLDALAGMHEYYDVDETITVHVRGTSAPNAYRNLQTLLATLEDAHRKIAGGNLWGTMVQYVPPGSTEANGSTTFYQAAITQIYADTSGPVQLAPEYQLTNASYMIRNVKIRFRREGLWTLTRTPYQKTASTTAGTIANVGQYNLETTLNPDYVTYDIRITNSDGVTRFYANTPLQPWLIAWGDAVSLFQASTISLTGTPNFTSVSDTANLPYNTNVLRFSPANALGTLTTNQFNLYSRSLDLDSTLAIYATVRNNSGVSFAIGINAGVNTTYATTMASYPEVVIDNATNNPRVVFLGTVSGPTYDLQNMQLRVRALAATTSSLDIDEIVAVPYDDLHNAFWVTQIASYNVAAGGVILATSNNPQTTLVGAIPGRLVQDQNTGNQVIPWQGNILCRLPYGSNGFSRVNTKALLLAPNGVYWSLNNSTSKSNITFDLRITPQYVVTI